MPGSPVGGGSVGGGVVGGVVDSNWLKNLQISPEVQVRESLGLPDPSTGLGVWSPSNAAHCTG